MINASLAVWTTRPSSTWRHLIKTQGKGSLSTRKTNEFPENFWKLFLSWISRKTSKKGGGHFRSEKFHCKFSAGATGLRKKSQWNFPKKGRSKAVRKFSRNSSISETTGFPKSWFSHLGWSASLAWSCDSTHNVVLRGKDLHHRGKAVCSLNLLVVQQQDVPSLQCRVLRPAASSDSTKRPASGWRCASRPWSTPPRTHALPLALLSG